MTAALLASGVATLLADEITFQADIDELLGFPVSNVLTSNRPLAQIPANLFPCFVIEQDDGEASSAETDGDEGLTIGCGEQTFRSRLLVSLVWTDQDNDRAGVARATLPEIFTRLLLRNPQPGGVLGAWLSQWQPDKGVNHPLQIWRATITSHYTVTR